MAQSVRINLYTSGGAGNDVPDLAAALPALGRLRLNVFRAWPYLYDGSEAYETEYLLTYLKASGAAVAVAWDGADAVGASTCLPLPQAPAEVQAPFAARGWDTADFYYFGESVLLPAYRGHGIGVRFFELREAHANAAGRARFTAFCAVQRPAGHPMRPANAAGLEDFWQHRGYTPWPDLVCHMEWTDIGQTAPTPKPLMFWMKALHGEALP